MLIFPKRARLLDKIYDFAYILTDAALFFLFSQRVVTTIYNDANQPGLEAALIRKCFQL